MSLLPSKKTTPMQNLSDYSILLYGREKIGKTTFCAQFPAPLFIGFEPGTKALSVYKVEIKKWTTFRRLVRELEGTNKFQTIIIDTGDEAYRMCQDCVCQEHGVTHPSEEDHGKGWDAVSSEFRRQIMRLMRSGRGVMALAHQVDTEIKSAGGGKYTIIRPSLGAGARKLLCDQADIIAYYYFNELGEREIRIVGTDLIVAGNRVEGRFKGLETISAGKSSKEAYTNFIAAFNNEYVGHKNLAEKYRSREKSHFSTKGKNK